MSEGRKEPLTHAGLIAHKLAVEARADVIGEQCNEDGPSLKTVIALLCYEIASSHCIQQWSTAKMYEFNDFARPEPVDAGVHATGWRCSQEMARSGNLALRAQDRVVRGALALQRLYALIGGGDNDGTWTWARPDWLDAFPEMTPENLAKANAAQKAADDRRRREAEEARKQRESESSKLHATSGQRRGRLRNGNPAGDYLAAPRCGATTRSGSCCRQPAMANGRCRFHGGRSTGPRTAEGLRNSRTARFVHGGRTAEIIDLRAYAARNARRMRLLLATAKQGLSARAATTPCHARASGHPGEATESAALDSRLRGNDSGEAPAGHGLHRSVSPASLESVATEAQRDRVARVMPLHQKKNVIARAKPAQNSFKASLPDSTAPQHLRSSAFICGSKLSCVPQAAKESRRNALLASTAAFTSPLCVSVPLWFKAAEHGLTVSTPAGHGLHRSFSPLARRTPPKPAAPSASRPAPAARSSRARRLAAA